MKTHTERMQKLGSELTCPTGGCDNWGTITNGPDENGEFSSERCQFCYMRDKVIASIVEETQKDFRSSIKRIFNGYGGMLGFSEYDLIELIIKP